jgi:O-antigen/teichoic acid export membrane protein
MFLSEYLGYVILVRDREWMVARSLIVSTSFNILTNFLLIPRYGLMAAAWVTLLTEALLVGQYGFLLRLWRGVMADWRLFVKPALAAAGMGLALEIARGLPLGAMLPLGALVYGLALWALGALGPAEWHLLRQIVRRTPVAGEVG